MQLIISLHNMHSLLHAVCRRPHPTPMDMVHRVTCWMSFMWLESSDSHSDFKSAFLFVGRAGSVVLAGNMWKISFCHHIQGYPHRNVLPRDDSRIATKQQMDWSNCVSHSGTSWHFWNIIQNIHFRCAHQIAAYSVSIFLKYFIEDWWQHMEWGKGYARSP